MNSQIEESNQIYQNNKTNKNPGSRKFLIAIVVVLALGSIAGGIFWFLKMRHTESNNAENNSSMKDAKADLKSPQKSKNEISKQSNQAGSSEASDKYSRYIEIPEWKIKIGIPKNTSSLSYKVNSFRNSICISATSANIIKGMHYAPEFLDIDKNAPGLACLTGSFAEQNNSENYPRGEKVYTTSSGLHIFMSLSQAVYSPSNEEVDLEVKSRGYTMNILSKNIVEM